MADDAQIPPSPSDIDYQNPEEVYGIAEDQGEVFTSDNPFELFASWFEFAKQHELNDANAMSVATVDKEKMPNVRILLLKDFGPAGFSFYSNAESAKGEELAGTARAALCFHWKSIRRQVRVRGFVSKIGPKESDAYFSERARGSQIGAWASFQSRELESREILERRIEDYEEIYKGKDVPRPDNWHGWLVVPQEIEFWVNRPFRLHDRLQFRLEDGEWTRAWLYP